MKVRTLIFLLETYAQHAPPKMYVPYVAADIDVRKNFARRRESDFQRLMVAFNVCHLQEHAAHVECLPRCTGATFKLLRQSWKVSALVDPRMPARPAHMLVVRVTS